MNERNTDIHTLLNEVFEHATHTAEPETFYIPLAELESACTDSSTRDTLACTCAKWIMAQPELEIQSALLKGFLYLDIQKQPTNPCRGKSLARPVFQHLLLQDNAQLSHDQLTKPQDSTLVQIPACLRIAFQHVRYDEATKWYRLETVHTTFPLHAERAAVSQVLLAELKHFVTVTINHGGILKRMSYNQQDKPLFAFLCRHVERIVYDIPDAPLQSFPDAKAALSNTNLHSTFLPILSCPYRSAEIAARLAKQARYLGDLFIYHAVTCHTTAMQVFFQELEKKVVQSPDQPRQFLQWLLPLAQSERQAKRLVTQVSQHNEQTPASIVLFRQLSILLDQPKVLWDQPLTLTDRAWLEDHWQRIWQAEFHNVRNRLQDPKGFHESFLGPRAWIRLTEQQLSLLTIYQKGYDVQYRQVLAEASSWRVFVSMLYVKLYPLFLIPLTYPELVADLRLFEDPYFFQQFDETQENVSHCVDAEGNTLLHYALQVYPQLPIEVQQRVQTLCLLSNPSIRNRVNLTPKEYIPSDLPEAALLHDLLKRSQRQGARFYQTRHSVLEEREIMGEGHAFIDIVGETRILAPVEHYIATHLVRRWVPQLLQNPARIHEAFEYMTALETARVQRMMGVDDLLAAFETIRKNATFGWLGERYSQLHGRMKAYERPFREADETCVRAQQKSYHRGDLVVERQLAEEKVGREQAEAGQKKERARAVHFEEENAELRARIAQLEAQQGKPSSDEPVPVPTRSWTSFFFRTPPAEAPAEAKPAAESGPS